MNQAIDHAGQPIANDQLWLPIEDPKQRLRLAHAAKRDRVVAPLLGLGRLPGAFRQVQDGAQGGPLELVFDVVLRLDSFALLVELDRQFIRQKIRDRNRCRFRLP